MTMLPLAVTCGDPAGVGPEVIANWLATHPADAADLTVIGPAGWLRELPDGVRTEPVGATDFVMRPGEPDEAGAAVARAAMRSAAIGCREGRFAGVVTGPVSKARLAAIGFEHPGQTEFFATEWGGDPVMAFVGDHLRVALATWHLPLAEVPAALSGAGIERAVHAALELTRVAAIAAPRIAVCGLNPHAGEDGLLGGEERDLIDPVLDRLRTQFPGLSRALPGDTVFGRAVRGEFDAVVALYHDQGLGPLKTLDFDNAVNVTLGLPHVRTSPDHGTGFDIAGRGLASSTSLGRAIALARRLARRT